MKRQKVQLQSTFEQLLNNLAPHQNAALLSGSDDGWATKLAWRPCDSYQLDNQQSLDEDFYDFITNHQKKGHLIVGFISYDLSYSLHNIPRRAKDDLGLPNLVFYAYDHYLEYIGPSIYVNFANTNFLEEVKKLDIQPAAPKPKVKLEFQATLSRDKYKQAFEKIKAYIYDGVIYQINLTQRLQIDNRKYDSRQIFDELSHKNTAKMMGYFEGDDFELISMSPERFISSDGKVMQTTPIKGTRARGHNKQEDDANQQSLLNDSKEQSELNMITDLLRNDLGKVCASGSVEVKANQQITKLTAVIHTHSLIKGQLKNDVSPIQALISMFPGGSVTGCPKRRAMELIDQLESTSRSAYCGNLVVINPDGSLDSSILIRTIIKKKRRLVLPVGSGIVYESDEESEYQENLDKASPLASMIIKN